MNFAQIVAKNPCKVVRYEAMLEAQREAGEDVNPDPSERAFYEEQCGCDQCAKGHEADRLKVHEQLERIRFAEEDSRARLEREDEDWE